MNQFIALMSASALALTIGASLPSSNHDYYLMPESSYQYAHPEDTYPCNPSFLSGNQTATQLCFYSYAQGNQQTEMKERQFLLEVGRSPATDQELCDVYQACDGPEPGEPITPYLVRL